jgi:hypothetical protein
MALSRSGSPWGVGLLSALLLSCGQSGSDADSARSNGGPAGACGGPSPEERAQNQLVFDGLKATCEGCHANGSRPYFASITSFESLVAYEPKLVTPGDPDKSPFVQIPDTNMADVCPVPFDHYRCEGVMGDWSGGAFDSINDRLIVNGGGHAGSPYNMIFTFDLPTMKWKRWTELPKGIVGYDVPNAYTDARYQSCALYPKDGVALSIPDAMLVNGNLPYEECEDPAIAAQLDPQQPRADHTYGNIAFSRATGKFYRLGSSALFHGSGSSTRTWTYDFKTGLWGRGADNRHPAIGGMSVTDAKGIIYPLSQNMVGVYDPVADKWTDHPNLGIGYYYGGIDIDAKRNAIVSFANNGEYYSWDIKTAALSKHQGTVVPGMVSSPGFVYLESIDRFVAWSGGMTVNFIDPTTFVATASTSTGDDPGATSYSGTYGRMRYSARCGVAVLVNATQKNVSLYKPPTAAP